MSYGEHFNTRRTPQAQPIPTKEMVPNNAGGYVFQLDKWKQLDRFLILGSEGGSYYATERAMTIDNAQAVLSCIKEDGERVVKRVVEISDGGRAPKNDPALFTLAMCAGLGDVATRRAAMGNLPKVARIGTHLFHFLQYVQGFRGWGRALKEGIANWYNLKPVNRLAYDMLKYRQRDGWSHADVLRLAHPNPEEGLTLDHDREVRGALYRWVTDKSGEADIPGLELVTAYAAAQKEHSVSDLVYLIKKTGLTREMIPNQWLNEPKVWEALLEKMPLTAMLRNLGKMSQVGLLAPMSPAADTVAQRLTDKGRLSKARIHPLSVLNALKTYQSGQGVRGSLRWEPVSKVVNALDEAFYLAFDNVEPTGKRIMLALDVSGSMGADSLAGMPGITPRVGSAAMAMVTARTESSYIVTGFTAAGRDSATFGGGWNKALSVLDIDPRRRLDDIVQSVSRLPMGGTDCALPMLYALEKRLSIDVFIIYTDNETWAGDIHPAQALQEYRQKMSIPAKLIVVGMTATGFSIADPDDADMLDMVGFDTAAPGVMAQFIKDEV